MTTATATATVTEAEISEMTELRDAMYNGSWEEMKKFLEDSITYDAIPRNDKKLQRRLRRDIAIIEEAQHVEK